MGKAGFNTWGELSKRFEEGTTTVVEPVVNETVVVEEPKEEPVKEEETIKITNYEKPKVIETVEDFNKQTKETSKQRNKETRKQGNKETSLQGNLENKQPKDYYYGGKHTFAIPDDLFDKFKFVTSIRKETQSGKIIELIEKYLEENGDLVRVYYLTQKQGDKK